MLRFNQMNLLRVFVIVSGVSTIVLGLNTSLGGIQTLGLRLTPGFAEIGDPAAYAIQDNNVRFYAGFFASAGVVMLFCARNITRYSDILKAIFIMIILGGLARLSAYPLADGTLPSFLLEIVLFPALYVWLTVVTRNKPAV